MLASMQYKTRGNCFPMTINVTSLQGIADHDNRDIFEAWVLRLGPVHLGGLVRDSIDDPT